MRALLISEDGIVQVIGSQSKSLALYIPYLEELLNNLREQENKELQESIKSLPDQSLRDELQRRGSLLESTVGTIGEDV